MTRNARSTFESPERSRYERSKSSCVSLFTALSDSPPVIKLPDLSLTELGDAGKVPPVLETELLEESHACRVVVEEDRE